jgi:putative oxidoreductase
MPYKALIIKVLLIIPVTYVFFKNEHKPKTDVLVFILKNTDMEKLKTAIRIVLGITIAFSGINKFGHWLNIAYMHDAMEFVVQLINIGGGFIITTIAIAEILIGLSLLTNIYSNLALAILLPLMVCILAFHIFLDLKGIAAAALVLALNIYLLYLNREQMSLPVKSI